MYSRYIPDGKGRHQRRIIPDPPPAPVPPPMPPGPEPKSEPQGPPAQPVMPPQHRPRPGRPGRPPPGPNAERPPGGGFLSGLLSNLDTEDLLILAVLALSLKEDGAERSVIWIAVVLYFIL